LQNQENDEEGDRADGEVDVETPSPGHFVRENTTE
jgi:hypothetical protein